MSPHTPSAGRGSDRETPFLSRPAITIVLRLPITIEGSYDLHAEFVRTKGEYLALLLPVGRGICLLSFSSGKIDGIHDGEKFAVSARTGVVSGRHCEVDISVRVDGDDATIAVQLNQEEHLRWQGEGSSLNLTRSWSVTNIDQVGLGARFATVAFRNVRLRPVTKPAK